MVIPFAFLCQDPHLPRSSSSPSPVPSLQRQVALKQTSGLLQVFLTTLCSSCNARCNTLQTDRHNNFLLKIYQSASLNQKTQSHLKTKKRKEGNQTSNTWSNLTSIHFTACKGHSQGDELQNTLNCSSKHQMEQAIIFSHLTDKSLFIKIFLYIYLTDLLVFTSAQ